MLNSILIGMCFYLVDPANGIGRKDDAVRVEVVKPHEVTYRWWNLQQEWATSTNKMPRDKFSRLFKILDNCPAPFNPQ